MNMEKLKKMAREIVTQDNRCTSHPIYNVKDESGQTVQPFFTESAAEKYLKNNKTGDDWYVYISSGWDNPEWIAIRNFLKTIAGE